MKPSPEYPFIQGNWGIGHVLPVVEPTGHVYRVRMLHGPTGQVFEVQSISKEQLPTLVTALIYDKRKTLK